MAANPFCQKLIEIKVFSPHACFGPAHLVVRAWVGVASIRWLGRIEVADHRLFSAYKTGRPYVLTRRSWSGAASIELIARATDFTARTTRSDRL
jgi:DMSO/TMAO reductase YedYZ molybdopterin-dependent catalytic subunit